MAFACGVTMLSAVSVASDIAVGKWERYTFDGNTPTVGAGEGLYLCEKAASVSYAGTGTWTLPLGNLFAFGNAEIGVRNGTLRLTSSATPDLVANPPLTELNKAALWLDAGKNVETADFDSTTCVIRWYDARATSAAASGYGYAEAGNVAGAGPVFGIANGMSYVSFIGYLGNASRSFLYKATGGSTTNYNIRHAFFVQRVAGWSARTAPVLGNTKSANFFAAATGAYNPMLSYAGNANPLAYSCDYQLDGVHGDATVEIPTGTHIYEFTLPPNRTIGVDSLMNDRNTASGGHDIHEILLFTEPLTVLERMRITAYLKAKWSCGGDASLTVNTAAGAVVEIGNGVSAGLKDATGAGTAVVGSGVSHEASHLYSDATESRPSYALKDGTASLSLQAAEYKYQFSPRDRLSVASQTKLSVLAKDTSGENGSASVTSERPFVVSDLDPAITNLSLSGGGNLVLRAPSADSAYAPGTVASATFAATSLSVPAGRTGVETTVEVPVAGSWEIEFKMYNTFVAKSGGSWADGKDAGYKIQLKRDGNVVFEKTPTVVSPGAYDNADQSRRYLVGNLDAGTYTFRAEGYLATAIAATMSNLSMTFVPNPTREIVVPVTDGDFESSRFARPCFASRDNNQKNTTTAWTLTNAGLSGNPAVQTVVSSAMGYAGVYEFMFRSSQLGRYGDNALLWYHNNSTATSPATAIPVGRSGTYRLRLDAVRWMTGTSVHDNVSKQRCNEAATLAASVTVNGGEPITLGSIGPISNFTVESLSFPNSFTVSDGDSVVVTLDQTTLNAAVQIDNLEFVKVEDAASVSLGEELVADGSFANVTSTDWSLDDWTGSYRHVAEIRSPVDPAYGTTRCDGAYVIRSAQGGRSYQTIAFPAGVFRLSWWSRARVSNGNVAYRSPVTFWYAADGAESTNVIVRSESSWCTNFLEHVAYFSVPTTGNYVFGFNSDDASGTDVLVDCVSVRQVLGSETTPDIPEYAEIKVYGGGKLRLDYNGCLKLGRLRVNGKSFMGEVSAEKYPDYISGPGRALVKERGFVLTYR